MNQLAMSELAGKFNETRLRSLTKTASWRCCAVMNSFLVLTLTTTSRPLTNAIAMNVTGFIVFYLFERVWNKIHWGRVPIEPTASPTPAGNGKETSLQSSAPA